MFWIRLALPEIKKQTFSVAKDYHKLISQSLEILNPGGIIIASTNAANVFPGQKILQNKSTKDLQVESIRSFINMDFQQTLSTMKR